MIQASGTGCIQPGITGIPVLCDSTQGNMVRPNYTEPKLIGSREPFPEGTPITFTINGNPALCYNVDAPNGWQASVPFQSRGSTHVT